MDRRFLALIIIIIVIIIAGVYLFSTMSLNQNAQAPVNQSGTNGSANNTNNTVAATISIQNGAFNPNNLTVKTGTNVQWINNDNASHQIISDSGAFQSPVLNNGSVYNFYFAKSGIFGYYCGLHPTETGTITVTP